MLRNRGKFLLVGVSSTFCPQMSSDGRAPRLRDYPDAVWLGLHVCFDLAEERSNMAYALSLELLFVFHSDIWFTARPVGV